MVNASDKIDSKERYSRQADIVPSDRLASHPVHVIGCGAIGRQVAIQLATIGSPVIHLTDFDTVEVGNLGSQGFDQDEVGVHKTVAVSLTLSNINNGVVLNQNRRRFRRTDAREMDRAHVVFSCVDGMDARKRIFNAIRTKVGLFIDGRMSAEILRVLTYKATEDPKTYSDTLFDEADAYEGSCTAKTTFYSSSVVAGIMVGQFTKWLRDIPLYPDVRMNLLSLEIGVTR